MSKKQSSDRDRELDIAEREKLKKRLEKNKGVTLPPFKHIRLRPGTYIGSIITVKKSLLIAKEDGKFEKKSISYNQGLERIFIEILSNAKDNYWNSKNIGTPQTFIRILADRKTGKISIENDGAPIPVKPYSYITTIRGKEVSETCYPAEKFFGEVNTGTNFEKENVRKKSSGLNGLGGKLTNVFSKIFDIEIGDHVFQECFKMTFSNNGQERTDPIVKPYKKKSSFTKITFLPDYKAFDYPGLDGDFFSLIKKHAYDCAATIPIKIYFNDTEIHFTNVKPYINMLFPGTKILWFRIPNTEKDEIVLMQNPISEFKNPREKLQQISFINGIHTTNGGIHVDKWFGVLFQSIKNALSEFSRLGQKTLYPYISLFVRMETLEDIQFSEQTKDCLVAPKNFPIFSGMTNDQIQAFKKRIDEEMLKIKDWEFVEHLRELSGKKTVKAANQPHSSEKHEHAFLCGPRTTRHKQERWGFILEGDSAYSLWLSLKSAITGGKDYWGGMAIRGKLNNIDGKSEEQIDNMKIITLLKTFFNLDHKLDYSNPENRKRLFYDRAVSLTDADDDGIHIKGLLLNFFSSFKGLIESGFFMGFNTFNVILKPKKKGPAITFYSQKEFGHWLKNNKNFNPNDYTARYFKGLGNHAQGEEHWYSQPKHQRIVTYVKDDDTREYIKLGFSKKPVDVDNRKRWMKGAAMEDRDPVPAKGKVPISEFIKKDVIEYLLVTLPRAIPTLMDGFKKSQRQAFYAAIEGLGYTKSKTVPNIAADVVSISKYHHGTASMEKVIINMAKTYPGTNNVPLFMGRGQFGTRKRFESGAPRYLYASVEKICQRIFHQDDTPLLKRIIDSGEECEPDTFFPIVPMSLINGAEGVACGWKTFVPSYNPYQVIGNIVKYLDGEEMEPMLPHFRGFCGKVELLDKNTVLLKGKMKNVGNNTWHVTELPPGLSIQNFKKTLSDLQCKKKGSVPVIAANSIREPDKLPVDKVDITFKTIGNFDPTMDKKFSCMSKKISLKNMNLLDENGMVKNYSTPEDIIIDFCKKRLPIYDQRKKYWTVYYKLEIIYSEAKISFINFVDNGDIDFSKMSEEQIVEFLEDNQIQKKGGSFDYLLGMQIKSITRDKIQTIKEYIKKCKEKLLFYKRPSIVLWKEDLKALKDELEKFFVELESRKEEEKNRL